MMMEDDDDKDDTKRKSRNLSEKKRRDQFNLLVNELSSMVSTNSRKMDKSTVLKTTIAFLKNHNEIAVKSRAHEIQENWKPSFLPNEEFTHLILEALDGFIIVFSSTGKIYYTSESITSLLGHLNNDLLNMTIYDLVYEEEQQDIYNLLLNPPKTVIDMDPLQNGIVSENQVSFTCHVKRGSLDNPPSSVSYEYVQFNGYFRDNIDVDSMMPIRYSGYSGEADTRLIFVGTGRILTPQLIREMSIVDTKSEFTSRHSLEWKFLFLDHRASPIIGYLPFEVLGTSGYDYYHFDDLDRVVTCHEALMQKGEGTSCYYRFLTKGQQWIWLQTRFYITYHQWNSKPEFVVCTHRVVSYADVMKQMRKNNGGSVCVKETDDNDSATEDRKAPTSTSMMATSPWSSKSSRASKSVAHTRESPNVKMKRYQSYRPDSDSTSMSADSPVSHHSMLTQHSSVSQRSRSRQNVQMSKHSNQQQQQVHQQQQHQQYSQFNLPHPQAHSNPQQLQSMNQPQSHSIAIHPPPVAGQIMTHHHSHHHHQRVTSTDIQSTEAPFIDQSQYITAIPVQQGLTAAPAFPASAVISPIIQPPDYVHSNVVLTSAQNQIQDHLQRKHEELQKLIVQQQDELRRVSEQLFMARYGILPSIVNVTVPFVTPMDSSETGGENSRCISTASHGYHHHPHQQQPQIMQIMPSTATPASVSAPQNQTNSQIHMQQQQQPITIQQQNQGATSSQVMHSMIQQQQQQSQQQHMTTTINYETQKSNLSMDQAMESEQTNNDILQYMQHQQSNHQGNMHQLSQQQQQQQQQQNQPQQQMITNDNNFEIIPYQMMNPQILFSSSGTANNNANNNNNNSANNK